jgi:hypothetical protein
VTATTLTNPVTGHKVTTDETGVDFWTAAGYRVEQPKATKKAAAKKSSSPKK